MVKEGKTGVRVLLALLISIVLAHLTSAAAPTYLYRTTLVQAAPGKLLEVIDLLKSHRIAIGCGVLCARQNQPPLLIISQ
jgi:hypothetical protein